MSWETGISEWDYYKFTANKPYSAPFHFKVTTSSGQEYIGYNVINSITEGDSGRVSLAFAFTADDEVAASTTTDGLSSGGVAAIVVSAVLVCCMVGVLYFVYRRKNKVIAAGIEDEEVEQEKESGYDMTTVGNGDGNTRNTGDHEEEVMIEVPVTETIQ